MVWGLAGWLNIVIFNSNCWIWCYGLCCKRRREGWGVWRSTKKRKLIMHFQDGKSRRELAVKHKPESPVNSFNLINIPPATEFTVAITTVCVYEKLKTVSEEATSVFISLPFPPTNMELESRFALPFTTKSNVRKLRDEMLSICLSICLSIYLSIYHN